jgi:hypothetical protein
MTPSETLASHPTISNKQNEDRRVQANLIRSSFRRREIFLATSADQTETLDEIPYEHWTPDRKTRK